MPSYTFTGLTPGRTASVFREGGGGNPRTAVTSGLVAGDSTLTVTLDTGNYRAEDGSRVAYAAQADDSTTQQADTAAASATYSPASKLTLGARQTSSGFASWFNGHVRKVAVYNRALTAAERTAVRTELAAADGIVVS